MSTHRGKVFREKNGVIVLQQSWSLHHLHRWRYQGRSAMRPQIEYEDHLRRIRIVRVLYQLLERCPRVVLVEKLLQPSCEWAVLFEGLATACHWIASRERRRVSLCCKRLRRVRGNCEDQFFNRFSGFIIPWNSKLVLGKGPISDA